MASWLGDHDQKRESDKDRWYDEPDENEMIRHDRNTILWETSLRPFTSLTTRKN